MALSRFEARMRESSDLRREVTQIEKGIVEC
jgi:hypothetical protein